MIFCFVPFSFAFACLFVFVYFQEYTEEFREIAGKGKKLASGTIADGSITLINQRHVGDDLPVTIYFILLIVQLGYNNHGSVIYLRLFEVGYVLLAI